MKAICVNGIYKTVNLGQIYDIETINQKGIKVVGSTRTYDTNTFAYVDDNNERISMGEAVRLFREKEKLGRYERKWV